MKINEIIELKNEVFYCKDKAMYVKVVDSDKVKLITSQHVEGFGDKSPLLEQLYSLDDIMNMDFVEFKEYTISEILDVKNNGKIFDMMGYEDSVYIDTSFEGIPEAYVVGNDDPLEDTYFLRTILDTKFVEVHSNECRDS